MGPTIKDWWDEQHITHNRKWLTSTSLEKYVEYLEIAKEYNLAETVLEVGCGTGRATRELCLYKTVDVLDISDVAIANVANVIRQGYLCPTQLLGNTYDLIIHHLVCQHMTTSDFGNQLCELIRSLKDTGILALQFADAPGRNPNNLEAQQHGGILYSTIEIAAMVLECGGSVIKISDPITFEHVAAVWYAAHIRRV